MTETIALLDRLVAFDTVSARSNLPMVDFIETHLQMLGARVTRVPSPCGQKAGLFASLGPGGAGVILSAHTDVVPVEGQDWTRDPFRLTDEGARLYGRGTTDMKGYLAAMLSAASRAASRPLTAPLHLSISYDEEVGCIGMGHMIDHLPDEMRAARAALVGEPTQMQVATGHKGKQALRAICTGQAGHSALAPRFTNALHVAADFMAALRAMQDDLAKNGAREADYDVPFTTLHVGKMSGGTALNIVPDRAELLFEFRHLAQDAPADLLARIDRAAGDLAAQHDGADITLKPVFAYPGLATDTAAPIVARARAWAGDAATTKVAFGTEAGFFDGLGISTVVCGPGSMEGQGHKPDEYITRDQLAACDSMLDRVIDDLCG